MWRPYKEYKSLNFNDKYGCSIGISAGNIVDVKYVKEYDSLIIIADYGSEYYISGSHNRLSAIKDRLVDIIKYFTEAGVDCPLIQSKGTWEDTLWKSI